MSVRKHLSLSFIALAVTFGATACSDTPLAPHAPAALPSAQPSASFAGAPKGSYSQVSVGDTTITTITLAVGAGPLSYPLGGSARIDIPAGASTVCDLATSSYGIGEWDKPCTPSAVPVTITARTWVDAKGLARSDFQPSLRFVPEAGNVTLSLKNRNGLVDGTMRMVYCSETACVDEAKQDPSLATQFDRSTVFRRIKHFSGYNILYGLVDDLGDGLGFSRAAMPRSGYITTTGLTAADSLAPSSDR